MAPKIVTFVFLIIASIAGVAQANVSQVTNLEVGLERLRATSQLPALLAPENASLIISTEQVSDEVHSTFNQIQKSVYGKDSLIALKACDGCQAVADAKTMSVYLEPRFLRSLKSRFGASSRNIIEFIVAHEISHFSYEFIVLSSTHQLSPNGNIPLLTKSFTDFVDLAKFSTMTLQEQQVETAKYLGMASQAHSEVDLLGLLTLKDMGRQVSLDAIKYLQAEVDSRTLEERSQTDFELRLKNVSDAVANGDL